MTEPCDFKTNESCVYNITEFLLEDGTYLEDIEITSQQTIFIVLQENALFCYQAQAFCAMRIIAAFTFSTPRYQGESVLPMPL